MNEPEVPDHSIPENAGAATNAATTIQPKTRKKQSRSSTVSAEERQRILELRNHRYGMRAIALRLSRDRKTIRRILQEEGVLEHEVPQANKVDPFRDIIREKVGKP